MANFLHTLRRGDACQFGTWVKLSSLETLELLAIAGFDFVVIDMEHAPHTFETAYRCIVGAQGLGMKALVRLPDSQGTYVQRILDSGADGLHSDAALTIYDKVATATPAAEAGASILDAPVPAGVSPAH